jgi:hypothetical protein
MKKQMYEAIAHRAFEDELDALLSLQSLEGYTDQGNVQMFSTSSCVAASCAGS